MNAAARIVRPWPAVPARLRFFCPGCDTIHEIHDGPSGWTFDGNLERPTVHPSVLSQGGPGVPVCHSFVQAGRIQYLHDCTHALAGQTVDLPAVADWPEMFRR